MRSRTGRTRVWRRWVKSPSALTTATENALVTTEGHPRSPLDGIITCGACAEPMALEAFQDGGGLHYTRESGLASGRSNRR